MPAHRSRCARRIRSSSRPQPAQPHSRAGQSAPRAARRRRAAVPRGKATIRSTVSLVEIDVQVTDRDGKPIKGLKQEQFKVTEDGKPQKVSTFEYNDIEKIETAGNDRRSADHDPAGSGDLARGNQGRRPRSPDDRVVLRHDLAAAGRSAALDARRPEISSRADDAGRSGGSRRLRQHAESDREFHERPRIAAASRGRPGPRPRSGAGRAGRRGHRSQRRNGRHRRHRSGVHRRRHGVQRLQYRPETRRHRSHLRSPGRHSRKEIPDPIHRRHHANRRGKPLGTDCRDQLRESLECFHLLGGLARLAHGHAGRRCQRGGFGRHGDVHRRDRDFTKPVAAGFARNAGDAGGRYRRALLFRCRRFRQSFSERAERHFRLLPGGLLQHGCAARRQLAARPA